MCLIYHIRDRWRLSMCICKQHVPVICTCTNIMLFFFKIGVKIKAIFKDSGSLQLPVCAYMPNNISSVQLFVPGFPTPRHSGFHHLQGYHSKAHKSIDLLGKWGGGTTERYGELHFLFFFAHGEQFINRTIGVWYVPAISSLELPDHLIYDTYHLPRTPDSLR